MLLTMIKPLWAYRGFILGSVKREFQTKYRNTMFGAIWNVLQPLAMIIVYTVIFSGIMQAKLPGLNSTFGFGIYLCAGILTWGLFAEITTRAQTVFLDNSNLLKKISFPRLCLPTTVVANGLLNFTIVFSLFSAFLLISGNWPGLAYVSLIPILALLVLFALGLGIVLGVLNVFFRDVGQFFGIFITFWFWLTPIVYPASILPESIQPFMAWNPMASIMAAVQGVLVRGDWPHWQSLIYPLVFGLVLCLLGLRLFRKHAGEIVDEL
jgi:lipopolysaccharide transport system permease protein